MAFRIGIDVGGTFTDVMASRSGGEIVAAFKVPSTPRDPASAVLQAITEVGLSGVALSEVDLFVHGTTLAVNTLLQRDGDITGLLVTKGFRDILEMRRLRLPNTTDLYGTKPPPLVPRKLVREVPERLTADGQVHEPLDLDALARAVADLAQERVGAIAVCFLHSYRNATHEREVVDALRARWPDIFVCASANLWPEYREYERCTIAVVNAYVGRRMQQYYQRLLEGGRALGLSGHYLSTRSNGGVMSIEQAQLRPVDSLLAGPAAGVIGAIFVAQHAGFGQVIGMDMGGTSLDVSVVDHEIPVSTESHIGDFPVIMPTVDVSSIGAGGGSIAWIDAGGVLKVGPRSAGAEPGPACYGRGGEEPTITDAYVYLGLLNSEVPLAGRIELHPALAERALTALGRRLGLGPGQMAQGIIDVATSMVYTELVPLLARRGVDPRDFALLAYGGAGPTHGFLAAQELGLSRLIVPPTPGTLCALGCLAADLRQDFVTTVNRRVQSLADGELAGVWRSLEAQAADWIAGTPTGVLAGNMAMWFSVDMRYAGQSFEIPVAIEARARRRLRSVSQAFHREYHRLFGVSDTRTEPEIVNTRVTVIGSTLKPQLPRLKSGRSAAPMRTRRAVIGGDQQNVPVYARSELEAGERFAGPAIVEQADTTTVVPRGFTVEVDLLGNLIGCRA